MFGALDHRHVRAAQLAQEPSASSASSSGSVTVRAVPAVVAEHERRLDGHRRSATRLPSARARARCARAGPTPRAGAGRAPRFSSGRSPGPPRPSRRCRAGCPLPRRPRRRRGRKNSPTAPMRLRERLGRVPWKQPVVLAERARRAARRCAVVVLVRHDAPEVLRRARPAARASASASSASRCQHSQAVRSASTLKRQKSRNGP